MPVLAGALFTNLQPYWPAIAENLTVFNQDDANGKMLIPRELEGFDVAAAVERMLDRPSSGAGCRSVRRAFFGLAVALARCSGEDAAERRQVHALRSAAENIGAVRLAAAAASLEAALLGRLAGREVAISDDCRAELTAAYLATMDVLAKGGGGPVGKA